MVEKFTLLFRRVFKVSKSDCQFRHVCFFFVRPHGTIRLPLGGLIFILIFEQFFLENVSKILKFHLTRIPHMKTYVFMTISLNSTQNNKCIRQKQRRWKHTFYGAGIAYSVQLRVGLSRDRIPVGTRFSAPVHTVPGAHPSFYTMGTGSFTGVKRLGRGIDHHPIQYRG